MRKKEGQDEDEAEQHFEGGKLGKGRQEDPWRTMMVLCFLHLLYTPCILVLLVSRLRSLAAKDVVVGSRRLSRSWAYIHTYQYTYIYIYEQGMQCICACTRQTC